MPQHDLILNHHVHHKALIEAFELRLPREFRLKRNFPKILEKNCVGKNQASVEGHEIIRGGVRYVSSPCFINKLVDGLHGSCVSATKYTVSTAVVSGVCYVNSSLSSYWSCKYSLVSSRSSMLSVSLCCTRLFGERSASATPSSPNPKDDYSPAFMLPPAPIYTYENAEDMLNDVENTLLEGSCAVNSG